VSEATPPDRFAESVQQAFDTCWPPPPSFRSASFEFGTDEEERLEGERRLVARADFVLPFAAAGLIDDRARVGRLPAPADIRREVREARLADRYMSVGCRLAQLDGDVDPALAEELAREWSTWLSFCMRAHSPELRRTLPLLGEARDAIMGLPRAPKLRIERLGPDGERLTSLVPRSSEDVEEAARLNALLDQCEIVAAHADAFRILGPLFPRLIEATSSDQARQSPVYASAFPFVVELWPFDMDSFIAVAQICDTIERLARLLSVSAEDEDRERRVDSYVR
jgi:hypothetical protein